MKQPDLKQLNGSNLDSVSSNQTYSRITPQIPSDSALDRFPAKRFKSLNKNLLLGVGLGLGVVIASIYGYRWWHYATTHQETDNAYVTADIHPISVRLSGTVTEVPVNDNEQVSKGDLLLKLDPRDYKVALQQAQAALESARQQAAVAQANIGVVATTAQGQTTQAQGNIDAANATIYTAEAQVSEAQAGVPAARAQLAQVEANLVKAELDYKRYTNLVQAGAVAQQQLDTAKANYKATLAQRDAVIEQVKQAQARVIQAQRNLTNAQAKLASTKGSLQQADASRQQTEVNRRQYKAALAAIAQSEAQVKNAQLQLEYTSITAPVAGLIGNKVVQVGQRVQPGQRLMAIVQSNIWLVANFKETQLEKMQRGQAVEIKVDTFPSRTFRGRVDSLSPAAGAKFALLPPDNATGNFTKVVQRVPVKIVLDAESIRGYESRITPGMSAVVNVEVQ